MPTATRRDVMRRILLITTTLAASWLGMQAGHEAGHVAGAWLTGGRVERVVVHPLTLSRTEYSENPSPLVVAWSAPVFGVIAPLLLWAAAARTDIPFLARFFAAFCLVANGVYIGVGALTNGGDSGTMLAYGSPRWLLLLFAAVTTPAGFWLWHREGRHFGLDGDRDVNLAATVVATAVCAILMVVGLATGGD